MPAHHHLRQELPHDQQPHMWPHHVERASENTPFMAASHFLPSQPIPIVLSLLLFSSFPHSPFWGRWGKGGALFSCTSAELLPWGRRYRECEAVNTITRQKTKVTNTCPLMPTPAVFSVHTTPTTVVFLANDQHNASYMMTLYLTWR